MGDEETVALIGGGHAVGKCHGACNEADAQGNRPIEAPLSPWEGLCGTGDKEGKAENTWTSGYELPWTSEPTVFNNEFFQNLVKFKWIPITGIVYCSRYAFAKKHFVAKKQHLVFGYVTFRMGR